MREASSQSRDQKQRPLEPPTDADEDGRPDEVSFKGQILHFLGEVEAVFGIWVVVLIGAILYYYDWSTVVAYIGHRVVFTEPMYCGMMNSISFDPFSTVKGPNDLTTGLKRFASGSISPGWFMPISKTP